MGEKRFGRDVFMALAAVGWADGNLDAEEGDAIVRTALEEGLELEDVEAIRQATQARIEMGSVDISAMSKADRLFVYAVGSWMTRLDGHEDAVEDAMLAKLGAALHIPDAPRAHADAIAREIAAEQQAADAVHFDLAKLHATIEERLAAAQRQRAEASEKAG
jgi:uncharacterized membrane protein YebE (DUF533 family)